MNDHQDNGATALAPNVPTNKHAGVTQVKNGYIIYAGTATLVAYTFDELVKHLAEVFGTPADMTPVQPVQSEPGAPTSN